MSSEMSCDLVEWDWLDVIESRKLHYAPGLLEEDFEQDGGWRDLTLVCGRVTNYACIPGVFTRMGARRCAACCDALGYPRGKGSPKNDLACRPLVEARVGLKETGNHD